MNIDTDRMRPIAAETLALPSSQEYLRAWMRNPFRSDEIRYAGMVRGTYYINLKLVLGCSGQDALDSRADVIFFEEFFRAVAQIVAVKE